MVLFALESLDQSQAEKERNSQHDNYFHSKEYPWTILSQLWKRRGYTIRIVSVWDRSHDSKARIFLSEIQNEALNILYFRFRMPSNQMALYPNWLIVYVLRVIVPMLMLFIIAMKILLKYGRDINRAFHIEQRYG